MKCTKVIIAQIQIFKHTALSTNCPFQKIPNKVQRQTELNCLTKSKGQTECQSNCSKISKHQQVKKIIKRAVKEVQRSRKSGKKR